jgi:glycosyltransferase involved in cell wall biosynthesis
MVSVVVPVYNGQKTIEACLKALLNQTLPLSAYEIIVVNDGSTDGTEQLVKQFPVRYFSQDNQGPAKARNFGVENASGDIILFTDSDCVPQRDWIELMTRPLRDGQITAVKGAYRTAQRSLVARFAQVEFEERYELLKKRPYIDFVDSYSAAFRKATFLEAGGFDTSFPKANNEDTEFSYKLNAMGCKMVFVPDAIVYHRHPDSAWKYFKLKFGRGYWRMVVYRRYPDKMMKDSYTPQTLKLQILLAFILCCSLAICLIWPGGATPLSAIALGGFLLSCLPFWKPALGRDFAVGLAAPAFLLLRAFALGLGVAWALWRWRSLRI